MQINLNNDEILSAIEDYVSGQGISTAGKTLTITLKAGRGEKGMSATVTIREGAPTNIATPRGDTDDTSGSLFNSDAEAGQD